MDSTRRPIVVVGSINMDLVVHVDRIPKAGETVAGQSFQTHPGGKGANQAVAAARLGWPVHMIGRLGDEAYGEQLRATLISHGVQTEAILSTQGPSGIALIVVASNGENSIVVTPGANALLTPADLDANLAIIRSAGMVLAQLEIPLNTVEHLAMICKREAVPLMMDPAPACALPSALLQAATWWTPNETEAQFYLNSDDSTAPSEIAAHLHQLGMQRVALKLGASGAYISSPNETPQQVSSIPVHAIDTTAAGDCFNGAFAIGLLSGLTPAESARFAATGASISVTRLGAQGSMPLLDEVLRESSQHLNDVLSTASL